MSTAEIVIVRDTSNHRVHKRFREFGVAALAAYEGCNADDAGAFSVMTPSEIEQVGVDDLCGRCFVGTPFIRNVEAPAGGEPSE